MSHCLAAKSLLPSLLRKAGKSTSTSMGSSEVRAPLMLQKSRPGQWFTRIRICGTRYLHSAEVSNGTCYGQSAGGGVPGGRGSGSVASRAAATHLRASCAGNKQLLRGSACFSIATRCVSDLSPRQRRRAGLWQMMRRKARRNLLRLSRRRRCATAHGSCC